jgi:hypothetical protein
MMILNSIHSHLGSLLKVHELLNISARMRRIALQSAGLGMALSLLGKWSCVVSFLFRYLFETVFVFIFVFPLFVVFLVAVACMFLTLKEWCLQPLDIFHL